MSESSDQGSSTGDGSSEQEPAAALVDPDRQCAVRLRGAPVGSRCQVRLSCRIHSETQKRVVTDRTLPYDELLKKDPDSLDHVPRRFKKPALPVQVFDPDRHCGVLIENGSHCTQSVTCTAHNVAQKRAVSGRVIDVGALYRLHKLNNSRTTSIFDLDINCGVQLPGQKCRNSLDCDIHTRAQKERVTRSLPFHVLRRIQAIQRSVKLRYPGGWGLASAASRSTPSLISLRRRYRRDGMQSSSSTFHPGGEVMEPEYLEPTGAGENLERLRQIMYDPVTTLPQRDILRILPQARVRKLSEDNTHVSVNKHNCDFGFSVYEEYLQRTGRSGTAVDRLVRGALREACTVTVLSYDYKFDSSSANAVAQRMRQYLERVPCELWHLPASLLTLFVLHAVSSLATAQRIPALPFVLELSTVDDKVSLLMRLSHFDTDSWKASTTVLALPIHSHFADVPVPATQTYLRVQAPDVNRAWSSPDTSPAQKTKLVEIASFVVSTLHLSRANKCQMRTAAAECSKMFGVALLVSPDDCPVDLSTVKSDGLAAYNPATGIIAASKELRTAFPWIPDIRTCNRLSADLTMEVLRNRFMHTKDIWISWADAAHTSDMHMQYGAGFPELLDRRCMCSADEALIECHDCHACGTRTVCAGLICTNVAGPMLRLCGRCRRRPLLARTMLK